MHDSVFTKIIKGEIPCHKIYEDDKTIAFLDINPFIEGHTLVVPKIQIDDFDRLPDEDYRAMFDTVKQVSARIKQIFGSKKAIVNIMGFEVPHAHVHIMPANSEAEYFSAVDHRDQLSVEPNHDKLAQIAERLRF